MTICLNMEKVLLKEELFQEIIQILCDEEVPTYKFEQHFKMKIVTWSMFQKYELGLVRPCSYNHLKLLFFKENDKWKSDIRTMVLIPKFKEKSTLINLLYPEYIDVHATNFFNGVGKCLLGC